MRLVAVMVLALGAPACGGAGTASAPSPSAVQSPSPTSTATSGRVFSLNGINSNAGGTVVLTTTPGTLTVELRIFALQASSLHVAHIHTGSCEHTDGIAFALNPVIADGQGNSHTMTTLNATYPPATGTWYVVVHAGPDLQGSNAAYLLCGNLFA